MEMKLTRREFKQNEVSKRAVFFRNTEKGALHCTKNNEEITEDVVAGMDFLRSYKTRIFKGNGRGENPFFRLAGWLVSESSGDVLSMLPLKRTFSSKGIAGYFTEYGKGLHVPAIKENSESQKKGIHGKSLLYLITAYYLGGDQMTVQNGLEEIRKIIRGQIRKEKEKLIKSITCNKVPFCVENGKVQSTGRKMDWLYQFLDVQGSQWLTPKMLDAYWEIYRFEDLKHQIETALQKTKSASKEDRQKVVLIRSAVVQHHKALRYEIKKQVEADKIEMQWAQSLRQFICVVDAYFKKNMPAKSKDASSKRDAKIREGAENYYAEAVVKKEVYHAVMNQLTAGLIQQGKLAYYCLEEGAPDREFTSEELSNIQIEEAFKKKLMTSLSWAVSRLNYLFCYHGSEDGMTGESEIILPDGKEAEMKGDILLEKTKYEPFENESTGKIGIKNIKKPPAPKKKKGKEKGKGAYLNYFLWYLYNGHKFQGITFEDLKQRLMCSFPINEPDEKESVFCVLLGAHICVAQLRHACFHYKKGGFLELLNGLSENKRVLFAGNGATEMLKRDIQGIQGAFQQQFRSYGIAEYYDVAELRQELKQVNFELYEGDGLSYLPSFRKVLKKGSGIAAASEKEANILSWYGKANTLKAQHQAEQQKSQESSAWMAYKNLLQILYYHAFLPAVEKDETLLSKFIGITKQWSRERSKGTKNVQYRYAAMPDYAGEELADYFGKLQREQSVKASDIKDGKAKVHKSESGKLKNEQEKINLEKEEEKKSKNYFLDFVQDVAMLAFHNFIEVNFHREILQNPQKREIAKNESLNARVKSLFYLAEIPEISMNCSFTQNGTGKEEELSSGIKIFYLFLRLLDSKERNHLQHQFIRYKAALKSKNQKLRNEKAEIEINTREIEQLEQLIELMALVSFTVPEAINDQDYERLANIYFSNFIEGNMTEYPHLYYQEDGKIPIRQKHMMLLMRSGAMDLYKKMFAEENNRKKWITKAEYKEYQKWIFLGEPKSEPSEESPIEHTQKELAGSHDKLVQGKQAAPKDIERYKYLLGKKETYNHLHHKLTFEFLYELHQIHIEVLGRLASFVQDWERDMLFLLTALQQNGKLDSATAVNKIFESGGTVSKLCTLSTEKSSPILQEKEQELLFRLCWHESGFQGSGNNKNTEMYLRMDIRNKIAHLNHITQKEGIPSLAEMLNKLRVLLAYDRKRQNAVTKAVKEILSTEHHLGFAWERKGNGLELQKVKSEKIYHLKKVPNASDTVFEYLHTEEMRNYIDLLFKSRILK